jgi:hypothetical protein
MKSVAVAFSALSLVCLACGGSAPAAPPPAAPAAPVELTSAPVEGQGQVTPPGEWDVSFTPAEAPKKAAEPEPAQSLSPESPASKATKSEKLNPPPGSKKK